MLGADLAEATSEREAYDELVRLERALQISLTAGTGKVGRPRRHSVREGADVLLAHGEALGSACAVLKWFGAS